LVLAGAGALVAWEVAALIVREHALRPTQVLPTPWQTVKSFDELSNYWTGGLGVKAPQDGGKQTFEAAVLALGDNALITASRLLLGMVLSIVLGVGAGLLIGYVKGIRRFAFGPLNFLGVLPLLATVPLFAFWFGPTTSAAVLFILFGAGIVILRSTLNAVENVPRVYVESAYTMGATRRRMYRTVIIPAILPELRSGVQIALTFSWSLALGSELIGLQSGLGRMMVLAMRFSEVNRMIMIGAIFVMLAASSVLLFNRLADRITRWAE
jgi:sulfonate transport system permease protein